MGDVRFGLCWQRIIIHGKKPVRDMHSTVQLCHADDMDATVAMLVTFMETEHEFMAGLKKASFLRRGALG